MLKPLGDRVIIETAQEEEKTIGGIVIANDAQDQPQTGKVIAVGEGRVLDNGKKIAPSVKPGDMVVYDKFSGTKIEYDEEQYLVVHDKDLIALVTK